VNSNVYVLEVLFIGSVTMTHGNSWLNLIFLLLLFIELGKILLGIYVNVDLNVPGFINRLNNNVKRVFKPKKVLEWITKKIKSPIE
jgi:hypothetical protein